MEMNPSIKGYLAGNNNIGSYMLGVKQSEVFSDRELNEIEKNNKEYARFFQFRRMFLDKDLNNLSTRDLKVMKAYQVFLGKYYTKLMHNPNNCARVNLETVENQVKIFRSDLIQEERVLAGPNRSKKTERSVTGYYNEMTSRKMAAYRIVAAEIANNKK
ncbi:MAG: PilN domain-containing protein [Alphaproteobacteria bacterium]|nr:PilN domain-containing protein [Alphaproteobacteria bacterium]MCL2890096.1 PilN domain-containing protein [Alphaproteobacteria bacterium]